MFLSDQILSWTLNERNLEAIDCCQKKMDHIVTWCFVEFQGTLDNKQIQLIYNNI